MSITSDLIRGHTDTIILSHLLQGDTYGAAAQIDEVEVKWVSGDLDILKK